MSDDFKKKLQKRNFEEGLFDVIEEEIDVSLKDSFSRFKLQKYYKIAKRIIDINEEDIFKI